MLINKGEGDFLPPLPHTPLEREREREVEREEKKKKKKRREETLEFGISI